MEFDQYKLALESEISDIEARINDAVVKYETSLEETETIRNEYTRTGVKIITLQYTLESLKKSLKSHEKSKQELETVNDYWEKSIRSLEYYNSTLESQLLSTEKQVSDIHAKLSIVLTQSSKDFQEIKLKCEEIKKEINKAISPVSRRPSLIIQKNKTIKIPNNPLLESHTKVVIVAGERVYDSSCSVKFANKDQVKRFEFNAVVKSEVFCEEINEAVFQIQQGGNACIVDFSNRDREAHVTSLIAKALKLISYEKATIYCVQITEENCVNLLPDDFYVISSNMESINRFINALGSRLTSSKCRNQIVITINFKPSVLQIVSLEEINDQASLSESLSINSSVSYLEELIRNLSSDRFKLFEKSALNSKLEASLSQNYFLLLLLHCESIDDLPILAFGARVQQVFSVKTCNNKEIDRTFSMLEKERNSNLNIMRIIEKTRKDAEVLKKSLKKKIKK